MLMRVSMVAAPWRRFVQAARWNGQAAQVTTGAASVRLSHCQYVNCQAGTIASATTGTLSATAARSRSRSGAVRPSSSAGASASLVAVASAGGGGRAAV
jgi:hypothetical protein